MDGFISAVVGFFEFLWILLTALWPAAKALFELIWWLLSTYPTLRLIVTVALLVWSIYWFADGVKNWRRKCWCCLGRGSFNSKISANLNRPCECCADDSGGAGRHPTIRSRIWDRVRGTKH